jgi:hypothetical protein
MTATFDEIRSARCWAVKLVEVGGRDREGRVWTREGVARLADRLRLQLPIPVASWGDPPRHPTVAELLGRGEPASGNVIGGVTWTGLAGDAVIGQVTFMPAHQRAHEALLMTYLDGDRFASDAPQLSIVAHVRTEPVVVTRPDDLFGATRISEGFRDAIIDVERIRSVDVVERGLAGGRFLYPTDAHGQRYLICAAACW